jgi:hypothetical protein
MEENVNSGESKDMKGASMAWQHDPSLPILAAEGKAAEMPARQTQQPASVAPAPAQFDSRENWLISPPARD